MATQVINNGDGTHTLDIAFTAESTKLQLVGDEAVHELYDRGFQVPVDAQGNSIPWASLTSLQKLDMLDAYVKKGILALARSFHIGDAEATAHAIAEAEVSAQHDLG